MDFWYTFWAIVWYSLLGFAFVAALMALFAVIADLFRDHQLSGWYKAIWAFFLVFVPFLTVFVYLIARGRGMADRSAEAAAQQKQAAEGYIRDVAGSSPSDEIAKARALLDAGTITQAEYEALKAKVLGTAPTATHAAV
ncbi:Phospholipase_D-nuclease N-terminal [Curtobacterium sp. 9128]|uniref:SHOCT domain-containing protein n=1 Tax=Curtobacterium sp. 9128 TaxID=1793722 RepID=UPI0007D72B59|nr:SHOCT domain-containing protein [Curtobacterium sp. 9128]SBN63427.1 Phospholipase_D-nuclease N-terminal [Curtobacterium sp. 9128]